MYIYSSIKSAIWAGSLLPTLNKPLHHPPRRRMEHLPHPHHTILGEQMIWTFSGTKYRWCPGRRGSSVVEAFDISSFRLRASTVRRIHLRRTKVGLCQRWSTSKEGLAFWSAAIRKTQLGSLSPHFRSPTRERNQQHSQFVEPKIEILFTSG